jgi:hypothetical protein
MDQAEVCVICLLPAHATDLTPYYHWCLDCGTDVKNECVLDSCDDCDFLTHESCRKDHGCPCKW